jgi:hypothetical protein
VSAGSSDTGAATDAPPSPILTAGSNDPACIN